MEAADTGEARYCHCSYVGGLLSLLPWPKGRALYCSQVSPLRLGIGDLGSGKVEQQLRCGTFEPGGDVGIARIGLVPISPQLIRDGQGST